LSDSSKARLNAVANAVPLEGRRRGLTFSLRREAEDFSPSVEGVDEPPVAAEAPSGVEDAVALALGTALEAEVAVGEAPSEPAAGGVVPSAAGLLSPEAGVPVEEEVEVAVVADPVLVADAVAEAGADAEASVAEAVEVAVEAASVPVAVAVLDGAAEEAMSVLVAEADGAADEAPVGADGAATPDEDSVAVVAAEGAAELALVAPVAAAAAGSTGAGAPVEVGVVIVWVVALVVTELLEAPGLA